MVADLRQSVPFHNFPIPNSGFKRTVEMELLSSLGIKAIIRTAILNDNQAMIDMKNITPGIYFIRASGNEGQFYKRIIIEN